MLVLLMLVSLLKEGHVRQRNTQFLAYFLPFTFLENDKHR